MKKILLYIVFPFALFIVAANFLVAQFQSALFSYHPEKAKQMQILFSDSTSFDVVYFGSSRALHGADCKEIESQTQKKVYNFGAEGSNWEETLALMQTFFAKHARTKVCYIFVDLNFFSHSKKLPINSPYYFSYLYNKEFQDLFKSRLGPEAEFWPYFRFLYLANLDDYTKSKALKGLLGKTSSQPSANGYEPLYKNYKAVIPSSVFELSQDSLAKQKFYAAILELSRVHHCKIRLLEGPYYRSAVDVLHCKEIYEDFAKDRPESIIVEPFTTYDEILFFADQTHLNYKGAIAYSKTLSDLILKDIENN